MAPPADRNFPNTPTVNASNPRPLSARIASGDPEAFTSFYRKWFNPMCAEVRRLTGRDESFCLDVVQEVMMNIIRAAPPVDDESALRAWLTVVVRRCALDRLRAEKRRMQREHRRGTTVVARTPDTDDLLASLQSELRELDPDRFSLLRFKLGLDWTLERIGSLVGLKAGAVDGRIGRTLTQLRQKLQERGHDRLL